MLLLLHACTPPDNADDKPAETANDTGAFVIDADEDGYAADIDCDDDDPDVHPDAEDPPYDGVDSDCDGGPEDDLDGDGYTIADDCDDTRADISPAADEVWYDGIDQDCDGASDDDQDRDGYPRDADCDDVDASVHPGAEEIWYDDIDQDCDGDPGDDADADGHGIATDCDDTDAAIHPDAEERCNEVDDNCDGVTDDDAVDRQTWYPDVDVDGYGEGLGRLACVASEGEVTTPGDCDDARGDVHPGATETDCTDPTDYNCDGSTGFSDADADGWAACVDCNDGDATISPDGSESCNGADDDCDGTVDEDAPDATTWYFDGDTDGHGVASPTTTACTMPSGYAAAADDCDDADAATHPGATEVLYDGVDQACDGGDDYDADADGSRYPDDCDDTDPSVYPGAVDLALNGVDEDCDGFDVGVDRDGDGLSDGDEATLGSDPDLVDTDADGLTDGEEYSLGTDLLSADTDADGRTDPTELADGTDPTDADTDDDGWNDGTEADSYTSATDPDDHPYTGGWSIDACRDSITSNGTKVGDVSTDFALEDQFGDTVRLHDFCDKAILLKFGTFW